MEPNRVSEPTPLANVVFYLGLELIPVDRIVTQGPPMNWPSIDFPFRGTITPNPVTRAIMQQCHAMNKRDGASQLLRNLQGKIMITEVNPLSSAAEAGVQPGDIIESICNLPIHSIDDVKSACRTAGGIPVDELIVGIRPTLTSRRGGGLVSDDRGRTIHLRLQRLSMIDRTKLESELAKQATVKNQRGPIRIAQSCIAPWTAAPGGNRASDCPTLQLHCINDGPQAITAIEIEATFLDPFGDPVAPPRTHTFDRPTDSPLIRGDDTLFQWPLCDMQKPSEMLIRVSRVKYASGAAQTTFGAPVIRAKLRAMPLSF